MKKLQFPLILAALLPVGTVLAGDWRMSSKGLAPLAPPEPHVSSLSYDYLDFHYRFDDHDTPFFEDGYAYGIGFSKSLGSRFFLTGAFEDGGYDYDWVHHIVNVDTKRYRLGLGVRHQLSKHVDLTLEGGAEHLEAEFTNHADHDYDSWGYYVGPGVRGRYGRFEFFAKAFYQKHEGDLSHEFLSQHTNAHGRVDDYGWVFSPGMIFHVTDHLGFKLAGELEEHQSSLLLGARYHF